MHRPLQSFVATAAIAIVSSVAGAATIPADWDFGSDPGKDDASAFTTSTASGTSFGLIADGLRYNGTTSGRTGAATTSFTGLSSGPGFKIEAVALPSFSFWDRFDIYALGSGTAGGTSSSDVTFDGIVGRFNNGNETESIALYDDLNNISLDSENWTGATSGALTMTLTATFAGPSIQLSMVVTDSNNHSQTLTGTVAAAGFAGDNYAGFGGYIAGGSRTFTVDTFSVVEVPEPAALSLLGLGGLALLRRQRA